MSKQEKPETQETGTMEDAILEQYGQGAISRSDAVDKLTDIGAVVPAGMLETANTAEATAEEAAAVVTVERLHAITDGISAEGATFESVDAFAVLLDGWTPETLAHGVGGKGGSELFDKVAKVWDACKDDAHARLTLEAQNAGKPVPEASYVPGQTAIGVSGSRALWSIPAHIGRTLRTVADVIERQCAESGVRWDDGSRASRALATGASNTFAGICQILKAHKPETTGTAAREKVAELSAENASLKDMLRQMQSRLAALESDK